MSGDMESLLCWCQEELVRKFNLEVNEELIQYILSIESAEEIEDYIADLIQGTEGKKRTFIDELLKRWKRSQELLAPGQVQLYRKKDEVPDLSKAGDQLKKSKRKGRNKQEPLLVSESQLPVEEVKTPMDLVKVQETNSASKKKTKYLSLYTKEGEDRLAVTLPGRHPCECLGQTHKLINNCLGCGRIVCMQEGSGPCLFCGTLVCTKEEQEILVRDSNKSQKLRKKLMGTTGAGNPDTFERELLPHQEMVLKAGLEKAVKHKDKLLEYDKTSARRTQVIDDESDYFAADSNQWLSKQERDMLRKREEELRELRHASHRTKQITIDFAGRRILEDQGPLDQYYSRLDDLVQEMKSGSQNNTSSKQVERNKQQLGELVNPNIIQFPPVYVELTGTGTHRRGGDTRSQSRVSDVTSQKSRLRIQDRELLEMSDDGMCLSMHQPWASLLVSGIKRAEGRTWYTSHRGRLWIAAAAKRPSPQEITEIEGTYRAMYGRDIEFPKDYPTGCLLGCVDVTDCVSQEQYREQFTDQECGSPFVFICTNPQELLVKFPIKGRHKIWKLDSKIHQGMKKGLLRQKQIA
ncbi:activating signal cointegrator 1 [Carcharodon carcharias]|uniref:activating signal cointegrator 1 n=1 Tax=Carcharodon carcharias TaxID=13397 RepID=UPI001B7DE907|nr:activating signal cointegrator 1 [Carcharodon carcharias]